MKKPTDRIPTEISALDDIMLEGFRQGELVVLRGGIYRRASGISFRMMQKEPVDEMKAEEEDA